MIAVVKNTITNYLNLDRLTGPFLDKELRVSSRHRRNYLLRTSYIILLIVFVAITWVSVVQFRGNLTVFKSRMAEAGKTIVMVIIWFQFIAAQLIAVIMFCNSISDEIYHRTLSVLLTTPVTSFQIVTGKLLSKLFQIILLLMISLPLLAIVRIFGGVSWNYILSSLCITLTAVIFAGSLSMFFSVLFKRAYVIIIITILFLGITSGLSPLLSAMFSRSYPYRIRFSGVSIFSINPFLLLSRISDEMMNPRGRSAGFIWIVYCIFILFASFMLLFASARILRSIALAHAAGQKSLFEKIFSRKRFYIPCSSNPEKSESEDKIRHIWGPPVAWKEMKTKFSSREKMFVAIIIAIELIMIIAMYLFPYIASGFGYEEAHVFYVYTFMGLGVISTAIFSAGCITSEKEAHTWPLLLMTTLSDWQILYGKFVGILRRCLPVWILLLIYFCPFVNVTVPGVTSLILLIILIIAVIVFLSSTGIYFSSRFKNTNIAFLADFVLISAIWLILPIAMDFFSHGYYATRYFNFRTFFRSCWLGNPFIHAITMTGSFDLRGMRIRWPDNSRNIFESIVLMINILLAYIIAGSIFIWRAKCRFRKEIL
jgi:ABC-2 type transport system permease protein